MKERSIGLCCRLSLTRGEIPKDKDESSIRVNAAYHSEKLKNGETRAEILACNKYLLMMSPTNGQKRRKDVLQYARLFAQMS